MKGLTKADGSDITMQLCHTATHHVPAGVPMPCSTTALLPSRPTRPYRTAGEEGRSSSALCESSATIHCRLEAGSIPRCSGEATCTRGIGHAISIQVEGPPDANPSTRMLGATQAEALVQEPVEKTAWREGLGAVTEPLGRQLRERCSL